MGDITLQPRDVIALDIYRGLVTNAMPHQRAAADMAHLTNIAFTAADVFLASIEGARVRINAGEKTHGIATPPKV